MNYVHLSSVIRNSSDFRPSSRVFSKVKAATWLSTWPVSDGLHLLRVGLSELKKQGLFRGLWNNGSDGGFGILVLHSGSKKRKLDLENHLYYLDRPIAQVGLRTPASPSTSFILIENFGIT